MKTVCLSDVCNLVAGFAFKSKDFGNFPDKVIKITNINPPYVDASGLVGVDISKYDVEKLKKFETFPGDYVLAMTGATIGKMGRLEKDHAYVNQRVLLFKPIEDVVNKNFLFYVLSHPIFNKYIFNHLDSETAQPNISATTVGKYEFDLPDLNIQNKIADILTSLDKKISINTEINNNLEQQAQALFQQYFGSKAPNGAISDILDEMPKSKIKVGDAKDVRGPYPFFTSGQNILEYTEALVDGRSIFLNTGGNADVKYYIGPAAYSTDTWCIKAKKDMTDMLYLLLKGMQTELDSIYFEGSALRHLQKPKLKSLAIYIPSDEEIESFNSIVSGLFNKISANVIENKILEQTRDALLPKLMSGEIDVSKVDISDPGCLDKSLFNKETE